MSRPPTPSLCCTCLALLEPPRAGDVPLPVCDRCAAEIAALPPEQRRAESLKISEHQNRAALLAAAEELARRAAAGVVRFPLAPGAN